MSVLSSALQGGLLNGRLGCAPVQWAGFLKQFPKGAPKYFKAWRLVLEESSVADLDATSWFEAEKA